MKNQKLTKEVNDMILATGVSKTCATRRANRASKEGTMYLKAIKWGLLTFGDFAPTKLSDFTKLNPNPFKAIARYAYTHGFKPA